MATTITNANVDTLASAVAAPFGPLTRVSDVEAFPTPNSEIDIEFTDALGNTLFMTYEQLQISGVVDRILAQVNGEDWIMEETLATLDALVTTMTGYAGPPYSYAQYKATVDALNALQMTTAHY